MEKGVTNACIQGHLSLFLSTREISRMNVPVCALGDCCDNSMFYLVGRTGIWVYRRKARKYIDKQ